MLIKSLLLFNVMISAMRMDAQQTACVFCKIIDGRVKSQIIYRDRTVIAFMDHAPNNPGHVLVVPLGHYQTISDLPDSVARDVFSIGRKISLAIQKTNIPAEAFRFQLNSGKAAGQEVPHCHLHVIPRYMGEKLNTERKIWTDEELERVAVKIRNALEVN